MSENRLADTNFNKSQAIENKSLEKSESFNEAPTLAPLMQAYYDALKRRDEQALRKTLSSDTIKSLEEDMKAEKKKSLVDFILELETLPDKPYEIRNEKIDGESAIAEIKGGSYQVWTKFYFVKEAGEWKITNKSPDFEK
ncbi:MAG: nuclear transport factor 2 family protein [Pyrinomonadaceae bacterium]|nr:nuclear transport factor 2 family protein [Pyrinomonadaceae bacterium]MCX7640069.1 nuclear transport factor 2 family protein [Pyrinomonadaceae bacterium]MDW8304241.1 nuclear transport factor 2 family protein [Acidobacteriota bacterium]